ncbi:MAG: hypothetical protein KatS3mg013_0101 [Actinomycetota bacterium]|jgi:tRNA threonylcarbamoyl adenosine modification protein (Sua5/YciO/YrdC/YwlC family)|nr:MAG: hypothetical protein KatS3mg013_0101 [Actinomycetota bacterium]
MTDPVAEAAAALERGELVVLPTDTVYGLAARPDDPAATEAIFRAKGRPKDLTLPVLVASLEDARRVGVLDPRAERLARALWPGPATLVVPRTEASRPWSLGGQGETVGLRIPDHRLARALLVRTGPLAVTSANRSGEPPAATCEELVGIFGDRVAVYLCDEAEPLAGRPSTVVDLADERPRVLRAGALDPATIDRLLAGEDPLLDSGPRG